MKHPKKPKLAPRTRTRRLTPEAENTERILAVIANYPIALLRNNVGMGARPGGKKYRFGLGAGSADYVGCIIGAGTLLFIEFKKAGWTPEADKTARWVKQKAFLETWVRHGAVCIAASDAERLKVWLRWVMRGAGRNRKVIYAVPTP